MCCERYKSLRLVVFSLLVAGVVLCRGASGGKAPLPPEIEPDPKVQSLIKQFVNAEYGDPEFRKAENALRDVVRRSPEVFVSQYVYFSMRVKGDREVVGIITLRVVMEMSSEGPLRMGLIPLLEAKDSKVRTEAFSWLFGLDGGGRRGLDESVMYYHRTLLPQKDNPPPGLVRYLFRASPGNAMLLFANFFLEREKIPSRPFTRPRDLVWSHHLISTMKWRLNNRFLQDNVHIVAHIILRRQSWSW